MTGEVTVAVRVKPGARHERVGGSHPGPGGPALVVAVRERAVDGAATDAARRALARALGVRPANVTLRTGRTSRSKVFTVTDAPGDLAALLARLLGEPGGS